MKKFLLILAFICSVIYAAEPKDGDKVAIRALYEGNVYDEGWILQFFDGKNRRYFDPNFSDLAELKEKNQSGSTPKMLDGKIGYTYEIEYQYIHDKELEEILGVEWKLKITKIKELSGKPDLELQKTRRTAELLAIIGTDEDKDAKGGKHARRVVRKGSALIAKGL